MRISAGEQRYPPYQNGEWKYNHRRDCCCFSNALDDFPFSASLFAAIFQSDLIQRRDLRHPSRVLNRILPQFFQRFFFSIFHSQGKTSVIWVNLPQLKILSFSILRLPKSVARQGNREGSISVTATRTRFHWLV